MKDNIDKKTCLDFKAKIHALLRKGEQEQQAKPRREPNERQQLVLVPGTTKIKI